MHLLLYFVLLLGNHLLGNKQCIIIIIIIGISISIIIIIKIKKNKNYNWCSSLFRHLSMLCVVVDICS